MFQSHAGSIEAIPTISVPVKLQLFQSHAGSIEARVVKVTSLFEFAVSIPRWFD